MERMWDSIKRGLQDGAAISFDKAEGLTQVGRARLDIAAAKTRLSRLKLELGDAVFRKIEAGHGTGVADDGRVRDLCDLIRKARSVLDSSEEEFEQVRRGLQAQNDDADSIDPGEPPVGG